MCIRDRVSAAGSTSWQSFTVTNTLVAATDVVYVCQKSGTCLLYTSDAADDLLCVATGGRRILKKKNTKKKKKKETKH